MIRGKHNKYLLICEVDVEAIIDNDFLLSPNFNCVRF
jgi:hypothetical protein